MLVPMVAVKQGITVSSIHLILNFCDTVLAVFPYLVQIKSVLIFYLKNIILGISRTVMLGVQVIKCYECNGMYISCK